MIKRTLFRICAILGVVGQSMPAVARQTHSLERPDGSRISFHVDRHGTAAKQGAILLLQGSGCDLVASNDRVNSAAPVIAPGYAAITVEKYGTVAGAGRDGLVEGCTPEYWAGNTLQQRVLDVLQAISKMRGEAWWNGKLIIFGGSEGGAVAALLAPLIPETRAVIVYSAGIGVPVGELIRAAVPPPLAAEAPGIFAEAKANPTGQKIWAGASYRWWSDAVDITPAKMLLQTEVPILLIHGAHDRSAPVATARATRDLLASQGRRNLTFREYQDYNHFMKDAAGVDHRDAVLREAAAWVREKVR